MSVEVSIVQIADSQWDAVGEIVLSAAAQAKCRLRDKEY